MTNEEKFGATPEEWLRRWDAGEDVYTVEMGGMGPEYEHPIHEIAAEVLRYFIKKGINKDWISAPRDETQERSDELAGYRAAVYVALNFALRETETYKRLKSGLSGGQVEDGIHVALQIYRHGSVGAFTHPSLDPERLIVLRNDNAIQTT